MNFIASTWEIVWDVLGWFRIATFIDEWEEGVLLRRGRYVRNAGPGVCWHLPLDIDVLHTLNVKPDAMELDEQVLTTADDKKIVVRCVMIWSIFDIKKCIVDVEDASDTLSDIAVGYVQELVEETKWDGIRTKAFRSELKRRIQKQARKYGITVSAVKLADLAQTRVYRLIS
jgi:regulator of protease activity HflC (stomatin/prohibitin superfamily)